MECAICHKREPSKTRCVGGHYVCNDCHTQGMDAIFGLCLAETSADPIAIIRRMMDLPFCHMHGPEHHVMVGAALLTAYKNAGGQLNLESALREMYSRGKAVPGGACGFWGACGAGISAGQFLAIATASTPLAVEPWGLSNRMTARALDSIGKVGGPRCAASGTLFWPSWPPWTSSGSIWGWRWRGACPSAHTASGTASASAGAAPSRRQSENLEVRTARNFRKSENAGRHLLSSAPVPGPAGRPNPVAGSMTAPRPGL